MSLYDLTKRASSIMDEVEAKMPAATRRHKYSVLTSTTSELGELAQEVAVDQGNSYKKPTNDGIVGEAIDTIVCLLDLIHIVDPKITEEQLCKIALIKLEKWITKVDERQRTMVGSPAGNPDS